MAVGKWETRSVFQGGSAAIFSTAPGRRCYARNPKPRESLIILGLKIGGRSARRILSFAKYAPHAVRFQFWRGTGGTDINAALAYCEKQIQIPSKTHLVLIADLYKGGDVNSMLARVAAIKQSGVNVIVLLALSDSGHPAYEAKHAGAIASLGCPVFACTPDQFPSMMAGRAGGKRFTELGS